MAPGGRLRFIAPRARKCPQQSETARRVAPRTASRPKPLEVESKGPSWFINNDSFKRVKMVQRNGSAENTHFGQDRAIWLKPVYKRRIA
jgi:hypothetical protein